MDNKERHSIDFEAYERMAEPHKREKASAWRTAIGLQQVDGLKVSDYLRETYDIQQEKDFSYSGLSSDEIIEHIADFVTLLWQNHPFCEGNTRTTAVFVIKYLRSIGFKEDNNLFAGNSCLFRNALVRANYRNPSRGIEADKSFLLKFFRNLMLGEHNELRNRYMLIGYADPATHTSTRTSTYGVAKGLSETVIRLIVAIGSEEKSVREMMDAVGLKNRPNFIEYSLQKALEDEISGLPPPSASKVSSDSERTRCL